MNARKDISGHKTSRKKDTAAIVMGGEGDMAAPNLPSPNGADESKVPADFVGGSQTKKGICDQYSVTNRAVFTRPTGSQIVQV